METEFVSILDECIRRIEAGEEPRDVLRDYPEQSVEIAPLLDIAQEMYMLSPPQGSTAAALVGQQRMLKKFDKVQDSQVLNSILFSREYWMGMMTQISKVLSRIFPKENMMYRKPLIAFVFLFVFLFTGTTMTAYAAQVSLPGDTLFAVKTTLEDLQINTTWDTADEVEKSIEFADRRIQEIVELINRKRGDDIPVGVERFEYHLREALGALSVIAKNDPNLAQELSLVLANLLEEQSTMITALIENNPDVNLMALSEALTAASLSRDTVGSFVGIPGGNDNSNGTGFANENDDDGSNENGDGSANENDDDDANENDDDDGNENDDDDANENDDDDGNENDDDDTNENDDDDGNENDDDDGNENDDDGANENDDDKDEDNSNDDD